MYSRWRLIRTAVGMMARVRRVMERACRELDLRLINVSINTGLLISNIGQPKHG